MPGSFFGFVVYSYFYKLTDNPLFAIFVGMSAFVTLESAGIWSGHKIAEYLGDRSWLIIIPIATFVSYTAIGIGTLWFLDEGVDGNIKVMGTAMFLLAGVVYILFGLQTYQERMDARAKRNDIEADEQRMLDEDRAYEREEDRKDRALKRRLTAKGVVEKPAASKPKREPVMRYDEAKLSAVRVAIESNPGMAKQDLAELVGMSRPTLNKYLDKINEGK